MFPPVNSEGRMIVTVENVPGDVSALIGSYQVGLGIASPTYSLDEKKL